MTMKTLLIKGLTMLGIGAVLFGAVAPTPALADGRYNGKPPIHHRHHRHHRWHRHIIRRK
jgi:hypothetical protein